MTSPSSGWVDPYGTVRGLVAAGRFPEARTALSQFEHRDEEWWLWRAMTAWRLGELEESLTAARVALKRFRDRGDSDGEMRASNVAAAGAIALGQLTVARDGFERALFLAAERRDTMMMARCANNLGGVEYYLGENDRALRHFARAVREFEHLDAAHGIAEAEHNRGVVFREEGDLPGAKKAADRALAAAERSGDLRAIGWALGGRAETDLLLGDLRLGEAEARSALARAQAAEDLVTQADVHRVLAVIARKQRDAEKAGRAARLALEIAQQVGNPWMIAKIHVEVANGHRLAGNTGDAASHLQHAVELLTRMGAVSRADSVREQLRHTQPEMEVADRGPG